MSSAPYMVNGLAMPPPPSPQQPEKESPSPQKAVSKSPTAHMVGGLTMPPPPVDPTPSGPRMVGGLSMPPLSAADSGPRMVGGLTMPPLSAADSGPRMVGGLTMPPLSAAITGPSTSQQPSPPVSQSPEPKPISPAPEAAPKRRGRPPKPENQRRAPRISPYTDEDLEQRRDRKALRTYWFTGATHKDRQKAIDVYTGGNKYDWMKNVSPTSYSPLTFLFRFRHSVQLHRPPLNLVEIHGHVYYSNTKPMLTTKCVDSHT